MRRRTYEEALEFNLLIGTPDSVTDKLKALQAEFGLSGILAELNCGGLIPHRDVVNAMRLMCEEVMPQFTATPAPAEAAA